MNHKITQMYSHECVPQGQCITDLAMELCNKDLFNLERVEDSEDNRQYCKEYNEAVDRLLKEINK
jgi:hypothetical protein